MIDILLEYGGEIMLAIVYVLCTLFGRKKTAEEIQKKVEKKRIKLLDKASKQTLKADNLVEKAEKLEVYNNDTIS